MTKAEAMREVAYWRGKVVDACRQCCGGDAKEARKCTAKTCEWYECRKGKMPKRAERPQDGPQTKRKS